MNDLPACGLLKKKFTEIATQITVINAWKLKLVYNLQNCACCYPGGCLCEQSAGHLGDTCVQCGNETALVACQTASKVFLNFSLKFGIFLKYLVNPLKPINKHYHSSGWHPLELNAAVGLQYQLDNDAKVLQQVLITEKDNTIHFFKLVSIFSPCVDRCHCSDFDTFKKIRMKI